MQGLKEKILASVPTGQTVDRAQLAVGANYDSVGRVLRRLVDDGMIVQVARGRYRRGVGKRAISSSNIAQAIDQRIGRSKRNVFLRSDFAGLGSYDGIGRALRQLTGAGRLIQIGYGLYAKAERSPFTGKPAPVIGIKRLATEALSRLGKSVEPSMAETAYNKGRSTQVPTGRAIRVKDRVRRRIGYDGNYVVLERA